MQIGLRQKVRDSMEKSTKTYSDGTHGAADNLPCKIGDTVYQITKDFISEYEITSVTIYPYGIQFSWECTKGIYKNVVGFADFEIGETVFLTREEAEAKLKEMEGNHDGE